MSAGLAAYRFITGKSPATATSRATRVRELEGAAGSGRAAARLIGISDSAWRRYKAGSTPKPENEKRIADAVRRQRLKPGREKRLRKTPPAIVIDATIRVSDDERERRGLDLTDLGCVSDHDWGRVLDVYLGGQDLGDAMDVLIRNAVDEYIQGATLVSYYNVKVGRVSS